MVRRRLLAMAILLELTVPMAASTQPVDPPAVIRTLPSTDDRVVIPIHIGSQGPWPFVVDTGAQRTVLSRDLAEKLRLPLQSEVTIISMTGRSVAKTVAIAQLSYGTVTVDDIEAPVLEGAAMGAPGLLGLDSLHAKRLLLDFRTGRMEVTGSRKAKRDPDAIIVEARRRQGQLILLDSDVNGMKVDIILDTGTHLSVGNMALMRKLMVKKRAPALQTVSLISVTGETLEGQLGRIDRVRMGSIQMKDMPVMFADAHPFHALKLNNRPALLLGIDALKMFDRVAIDFGRGRVDFLMPSGSMLIPKPLAGRRSASG